MEVSSQWAKALESNITEYTKDGFATHPDSTAEVFNISNSKDGIIRFKNAWGPRIVPKANEGASTHEASIQDGYETISTPQVFKEKISITKEMASRNKYPEIMRMSKDLGSAGIESINLFGNSVFINAFSTSYTSYGDTKPLCSVSHTRADGGTAQSNASATGITFTESNLETGMIALKQQKTDTGKKLNIGNNITLMVGEQLEKEAVIVTGSLKRSGTGNNDLNWYLGKIAVYINPWIGADTSDLEGNTGSDTAWYLFAKGNTGLEFIWESRPSYRTWENEDTDYIIVPYVCKDICKNSSNSVKTLDKNQGQRRAKSCMLNYEIKYQRGKNPNSRNGFKKGHKKYGDIGWEKGNIPWNKGLKTGLIPKSAWKKGQIAWNKGIVFSLEWRNNIRKALQGDKSSLWRGGKSFEPYDIRFNNELKEIIRKRDNYICQECSSSQNKLSRRLHIHHIDYDKKNNIENNLISLCHSCHNKTSFNRERWTDYFKNIIQERCNDLTESILFNSRIMAKSELCSNAESL